MRQETTLGVWANGWLPISTDADDVVKPGCPAELRRELEEQIEGFRADASKKAPCVRCEVTPAGRGSTALLALWAMGRASMVPAVYVCRKCWLTKGHGRTEKKAREAIEAMLLEAQAQEIDDGRAVAIEAGILKSDSHGGVEAVPPYTLAMKQEDGSVEIVYTEAGVLRMRDYFTAQGDADRALSAMKVVQAMRGYGTP